MATFTDQTGRKITLNDRPKRIISLVPSQTELLVDMGLKDSLVGITKFCVHPEDLRKEKEVVGGTKDVNFDTIQALNPDVILGNKEENTRKMVEQLKEIAPVHLSDVDSVDDTLDLIEDYGELFEVEQIAQELKNSITRARKNFQEARRSANQSNLKVAYFIWRKPWMVVGSDTFIDTMITEQGWTNAFGDIERYPLVKLEDLPDCDLVLLSSEPFPFQEKHKKEIAEYIDSDKIFFVDGEYFSWYGSRLKTAYIYFTELHQKIEDAL